MKREIHNDIWLPLISNYQNPDGNPIICTFFVPHEYTDYSLINTLYNYGQEIAVHSITKNNLQSYWRNANESTLTQEFLGMKKILAKFANIPEDQIIGARTPQFQLAGNHTIAAYRTANLSYDSSWPTLPSLPMFPYTLDYATTQQCTLGSECPNESFPGFWVLPINDLRDKDGNECNVLLDCNITGSAEHIGQWLISEVDNVRTTTKVPLTLTVNAGWFEYTENAFEGLQYFMDEMTTNRTDVFFVSQRQVMDWTKEQTTLDLFETFILDDFRTCTSTTCRLKKGTEDRLMQSCTPCPRIYPWLDNPEGN
ncbi:unnamed protein product [Acanthoscelides obtectus]|nr:unnamed protein product [Acanthoscelides obtectus]CAK1666080.1 hypothetical protein AOBTE_LOCUS25151 [Acanthoscelides obtectus]